MLFLQNPQVVANRATVSFAGLTYNYFGTHAAPAMLAAPYGAILTGNSINVVWMRTLNRRFVTTIRFI